MTPVEEVLNRKYLMIRPISVKKNYVYLYSQEDKRTSNAAVWSVWGDCGRSPLLVTALKQYISYLYRLKLMAL